MSYDERLAERIRTELWTRPGLAETRMFGGLCFTIRGHMCCGVLGDRLVLRLGPAGAALALQRPHTRPMDFTGRPLRGLVYVEPDGCGTGARLRAWLGEAVGFVLSLPDKKSSARARRARGGAPTRRKRTRG